MLCLYGDIWRIEHLHFYKKLVCVKHKTAIELSSNCFKNYIAHAYLQIKCCVIIRVC